MSIARLRIAAVALWCIASGAGPATTVPTTAPATARTDDPLYLGWAKQQPGAAATFGEGIAHTVADVVPEASFTLSLVDATATEVRFCDTASGKYVAVPATADAGRFKDEGVRDVAAAGRTFHCRAYDGPADFGRSDDERWAYFVADGVPGGLVRFEGGVSCCGQKGVFVAVLTSFVSSSPATRPATAPAAVRPATGPAVTAPATKPALIDNPVYKTWDKFKAGSTATIAGDVDINAGVEGSKPDVYHYAYTLTLVALAADHATIRIGVSTTEGGNTVGSPNVQSADQPARTDAANAWTVTGTADVTAMQRTFKCKVVEGHGGLGGGGGGPFKMYVCDDVPGGIVKFVGIGQGGNPVTMELTAFTAK